MPPRDHRSRHRSPHLSVDGFVRLHLTLLKTRLRLALATLVEQRGGLSFEDVRPGEVKGKKRKSEARRLDREGAALAQLEKELRAELVVAWQESREENVRDPIHELKSLFRLGELESELLSLALARHLDPSFSALFSDLGSPHGLACPRLLLALRPEARPSDLHMLIKPDSRLVRFGLLREADPGFASPLACPIRLATGVGERLFDHAPPLDAGLRLLDGAPDDPRLRTNGSLSHLNRLRAIVAAQIHSSSPTPIALRGDPSNAPQLWAIAISHQQGRKLLVADLAELDVQDDPLGAMRRLAREARFRDRATVMVDLRRADLGRYDKAALKEGLIELTRQVPPLFVAVNRQCLDLELDMGLPELPFLLPEIAPHTREAVWEATLEDDVTLASGCDLTFVAVREDLTDRDRQIIISRATSLARRRDENPRLTNEDLARALGAMDTPAAQGLAARLLGCGPLDAPSYAASTSDGLEAFSRAVRARRGVTHTLGGGPGQGLPLTAVFVGSAGLGKTEAAERVALEAGLDVKAVSVASLMASDPMETRRRIGALGSSINASTLLRLDVRQSTLEVDPASAEDCLRALMLDLNHSRHVTVIELETLELPGGRWLAEAEHVVRFTIPDEARRLVLWRQAFPQKEVLTEGLTFDALAEQFVMGGGMIQRAAVRAAMAASMRPHPDGQVTFHDLWEASRSCYRLMGGEAPTLERLR